MGTAAEWFIISMLSIVVYFLSNIKDILTDIRDNEQE